ncbi:MAG TPA: helix-turn-helix transcriptional regulator [Tepidisphaeraceae bacterium]|nr:helix-turn-helix transcriptional regulator [Tepidisphaeraceae bacterium]
MYKIIRQIHSVGSDTPERIVADNVCPGMRARGLSVVGLTDAGRGYDMQRPRPPSGHLLACYGGNGEVWVDGEWQPCAAGQAYVAPPLAPMAFRAIRGDRWQFAWVFMAAPDDAPSPITGNAARLVQADPRQIVNSIEGLYLESGAMAQVERMNAYADLISSYARSITMGSGTVDPLWRLWATVDASLNEPWTLDRLAARADIRPEALRRLCLRSTGVSPMRHVTALRMRRADALLRSTNDKLFGVARQVGYQNTFAFSTAFRRWAGRSPKDHRKRQST